MKADTWIYGTIIRVNNRMATGNGDSGAQEMGDHISEPILAEKTCKHSIKPGASSGNEVRDPWGCKERKVDKCEMSAEWLNAHRAAVC